MFSLECLQKLQKVPVLKGISPSPLFQYSDHSVINYVWENVYVRGTDVRAEQFFGFMKISHAEIINELLTVLGRFLNDNLFSTH